MVAVYGFLNRFEAESPFHNRGSKLKFRFGHLATHQRQSTPQPLDVNNSGSISRPLNA